MRAIVTVIGKDRVGIIAHVTGALSALGVNVLDISQTVLQERFIASPSACDEMASSAVSAEGGEPIAPINSVKSPRSGYFTMIMLVDAAACELPFAELSARMEQEGLALGMSIRIQREDIFDAMHKI